MKTKKLSKKLLFSKTTVANLNASEMNNVKGGEIPWLPTWPESCTFGTDCGASIPHSCHSNGLSLCTQEGDCTYYC